MRTKLAAYHEIERPVRILPATRSKKIADDIVMLKNGDFAKVFHNVGDSYLAHYIDTEPYNVNIGLDLPYNLVHMAKFVAVDTDRVIQIRSRDVVGKAMICDKYISGWYSEWAMTKHDN